VNAHAFAALFILSGSIAMLVYLSLRRDKSAFHWILLGFLLGLVFWHSGILLRHTAHDEEGLRTGFHLAFAGALLAAPCWLLLAAHYAHVRTILRKRIMFFALAVPATLFYFALITNHGHHFLLRDIGVASRSAGPSEFAAPLFWICIAWGGLCVATSAGLYLASARRLAAGDARRRGRLLALASVLPLATSALAILREMPGASDVVTLGLGGSLVIIAIAVFRYELLDSLPLARRDVIELLEDGVIMASGTGIVADLNPAAQRILRRPAERLRGLPLASILGELADARDAGPLVQMLRRVMRGAAGETLEVGTPDQRRIEVFPAIVRYGRGAPVGVFVILRDRSDERRYERIVRQTQKLETVGALAAGIAHEINNPLAFVRANLVCVERMGDLVEDALEGPDAKLAGEFSDLRQIVRETLDGVDRIAHVADDLRRLAAGHEEAKAPVSLSEVARDSLRLVQLGPESSPRVRADLPEDLPLVEGSGEQLMQVVLNLLVNAQHALRARCDGRIDVSARCDGEWVELVVDDDGPGVSEEIRDRIFDPFFTTKEPDEGMGLGLSVAFDIARDHGGVLEERSRPGAGARFALRLPVVGRDSGGAGGQV